MVSYPKDECYLVDVMTTKLFLLCFQYIFLLLENNVRHRYMIQWEQTIVFVLFYTTQYDSILCIFIIIFDTHSSIYCGLMFYLSLSKKFHFDALRYNCLFIGFQYSYISFFLLLCRLK